jgi:hypothetical protein
LFITNSIAMVIYIVYWIEMRIVLTIGCE